MSVQQWTGLNVLVTGVCGTVGGELLRQLAQTDCAHITGIDNVETELFFLDQAYGSNSRVELFLCDLRDRSAVMRNCRGIDVVLHAAALKHVVLCERSPRDAVATNIEGVMNVIDAAEAHEVRRLLFTSSDKAVNPTNVMGTTKLMGERLITAANAHRRKEHDTIFASTRFGNVLGSRGSVIPLFKRQIANGGPVTLTHGDMTRFIMTLEDAVSLVLQSAFMARGGEVFVTKMPVVRISDLAAVMIESLAPQNGFRAADIRVEVVGVKPGEKMYEELLSEEEVRRTVELENFFAVTPAFKGVYHAIQYDYQNLVSGKITRPYNSSVESALTKDELAAYLDRHSLLQQSQCAS
jgi:FlaA1/EpsC-like NDP-sugar epimerase